MSIEQVIVGWRDAAIAGVAPPSEFPDYVRAYRLKHFGRCPRCDGYLSRWQDPQYLTLELACGCGWRATLHIDMMLPGGMDDLLLTIARSAEYQPAADDTP